MYQDFYGLKDRPFALVPDPRYLFLSRSHREALAHLLYGIEAGDGFIEVFGQVGTGKTTLCRTLLGRVGSEVEIAYIFNPSPSEHELLAAINREFGLPTVARSRGELIEDLNRFLLEQLAQGRRCLLVIDEAQNLEPGVLEQIRLLSNLETEQEKLLQIVLIGQPELEENLARAELRQLRQRITVRWHLRPFDRCEVGDYLNHRLQVAGREQPDVFTKRAVRAIYRFSRGIPRVINAIADRALLAGYSRGSAEIGPKVVRKVARELPASETRWPLRLLGLSPAAAATLVACGVLLGLLATVWWPRYFSGRYEPPAVSAGESPTAVDPFDAALVPDGAELERVLLANSAPVSASRALDALLERWGHQAPLPGEIDPNRLPSVVRERVRLLVFPTRMDLARAELLDLPAIVELEFGPDGRRYAALLALTEDGTARLGIADQVFPVVRSKLERAWTGRAFYLWSNFESMPALLPGMQGSAVRWLQARLTELGYLRAGHASGEFDRPTEVAIRSFQREQGLTGTGEVGPETLAALYQRLDYGAPSLARPERVS